MQYLYKARYLKAFDASPPAQQSLIQTADAEIRAYCETRKAPFGLRVKLLYRRGNEKLYEARASLGLRILWAEQRLWRPRCRELCERPGLVSFLMVGTHDQVKRFLRSL